LSQAETEFIEPCYFYFLETGTDSESGDVGGDGGAGGEGGGGGGGGGGGVVCGSDDDAASRPRALRLADAAIIDATWKYRSGDSLERIQAMISSRLTAGVEDSSTGELAAWVLEQPSGAMGMLFTQEKFRRRGLARQVAVCVCVCV